MFVNFPREVNQYLEMVEREKGIKRIKKFYSCDDYFANKIYDIWKKEYMKIKVKL